MRCVLSINKGIFVWACLDSNQGPLPYQGDRDTFTSCRCVPENCLSKPFSRPIRGSSVRRMPPSVGRVGVSIGVKPTRLKSAGRAGDHYILRLSVRSISSSITPGPGANPLKMAKSGAVATRTNGATAEVDSSKGTFSRDSTVSCCAR